MATVAAIATLGTPHTSLSVAVIFFGCDGFAGSTDPTTSRVPETVLHAFFVSPLTLPFTVVIIPCGSDATPGTVTAVDALLGLGGQVASFGNTRSATTQLARSAVPVFISAISTRCSRSHPAPGRSWSRPAPASGTAEAAHRRRVRLAGAERRAARRDDRHRGRRPAHHDRVRDRHRVLLSTVLVSVTVQLKSAAPRPCSSPCTAPSAPPPPCSSRSP